MRIAAIAIVVFIAIVAGLSLTARESAAQKEDARLPAVSEHDHALGARVSLQCAACHGPKGATGNPTFPILAGQHASYLAHQLHHFRSGKRYNAMMTPVAQQLTDDEINAVAIYFSRQAPLGEEEGRSRRKRDF